MLQEQLVPVVVVGSGGGLERPSEQLLQRLGHSTTQLGQDVLAIEVLGPRAGTLGGRTLGGVGVDGSLHEAPGQRQAAGLGQPPAGFGTARKIAPQLSQGGGVAQARCCGRVARGR